MRLLNNLILLLSSDVGSEASPSNIDFLEKLVPNLWVFLIQFFAFIIMVLIVIKFAYKPIRNFLNKRREYIQSNLSEASNKNIEADKYLVNAKEELTNSKKEAINIIANAKIDANNEKNKILEDANKELAIKQAEASANIEKEKEKAIKSVHDEVVSLAIETSKSILNREVNVSDDDIAINSLVDDLMENK